MPYLDRLVFITVPSSDTEFLRFKAGDIDVMSRMSPEQFTALSSATGYRTVDAGPSLEYNFLFFNLNDVNVASLPAVAKKQRWFRLDAFRHAISAAIDRKALVSLVYRGRGEPLWGPVTRADATWCQRRAAAPGTLPGSRTVAAQGRGSPGVTTARSRIATGPPWSSRSWSRPPAPRADRWPRSFRTTWRNSESGSRSCPSIHARFSTGFRTPATMRPVFSALAEGMHDPNTDMSVWLSSGEHHFWNPSAAKPATTWERQIDSLMRQQISVQSSSERKRLFDRVQALLAEHEPIIFLASPDILAGARPGWLTSSRD